VADLANGLRLAGRQNNQFFRRPTYRPAMTGRGASLTLFLYDIHTGLPDRHDGPICVAHRLYTSAENRWGSLDSGVVYLPFSTSCIVNFVIWQNQ